MKLNLTQLDQTAKLMHHLDDIVIDWTIDCDDVEIITSRFKIIIPIATLNIFTTSTSLEIYDAIYTRFLLILENN